MMTVGLSFAVLLNSVASFGSQPEKTSQDLSYNLLTPRTFDMKDRRIGIAQNDL